MLISLPLLTKALVALTLAIATVSSLIVVRRAFLFVRGREAASERAAGALAGIALMTVTIALGTWTLREYADAQAQRKSALLAIKGIDSGIDERIELAVKDFRVSYRHAYQIERTAFETCAVEARKGSKVGESTPCRNARTESSWLLGGGGPGIPGMN